ncbi:MAG: hypothetical protein H6733_14690 [Alphaproteobacteria bacterium]|nr:hypothetical protein [Alphaproteobacteria bacterium]
MATDLGWILDELARDVDMIVFELEVAPPAEPAGLVDERQRLRKRLERVRERLQDLAARQQ